MILFLALKTRQTFLLFCVLFWAMFFAYPLVHILPQGLNNYWFWFEVLSPTGWLIYLSYCFLFALGLSFFIFRLKQKTCPSAKLFGSGFLGISGTFLLNLIPLCPACLSFLIFFVPLTTANLVFKYSEWIIGVSVLLMLFSLQLLGAFEKVEAQAGPEIENW